VDLLMTFSDQFPEENPENSNSLVQYTVRHLQSHNINATSPPKTHRVTHTFGTVQTECLILKMEATRPFKTTGTASHPKTTEQSTTPLTEPEITQE
jgi:hypothetical protein